MKKGNDMGYYTKFELSVIGETNVDHEAEISKKTGYSLLFEGRAVKWYDHQDDMREYSKRYPNLIFSLTGRGEEPDDIWREHYQNGYCQPENAIVSFPPFDNKKLK